MKLRMMAAALLMAAAVACDDGAPADTGYDDVVVFDTGTVLIQTADDTLRITVELATTWDQRAHGLMERTELPEDAGMLFVYPEPQPPSAGFYMFRTRIPLDIAFLGEDGRILDIQSMEPCEGPNPSLCPRYNPSEPFSAALEVNQGFFERHGVAVGDRVAREDG